MRAQKEENYYDIQKELEQKNNQIKTLQIKLDSQDIIISDYYSLKDKHSLAKNEILNLKKIIEDLKSNKSSLEFEIKRGNIEKENLQNNINELKNQLKEIKIKTNNLSNNHDKMENEINDYKKRELLLGTVQIENQTLNTKISTLNDIQNQKDKTIYELKDINNKVNIEKDNIKKENEENKNKLFLYNKKYNDLENIYKNEKQKNKELLEINHILMEDKKKLCNENSHLNKELQSIKNNYDILNTKNKDVLKELNSKSYILSEIQNKNEQ